jgi:hypothetical protein
MRYQGVVGTGRFELPTCRLGGGRSIHLSYVPTVFLIVAGTDDIIEPAMNALARAMRA